jgi:hypothetical protein
VWTISWLRVVVGVAVSRLVLVVVLAVCVLVLA